MLIPQVLYENKQFPAESFNDSYNHDWMESVMAEIVQWI